MVKIRRQGLEITAEITKSTRHHCALSPTIQRPE